MTRDRDGFALRTTRRCQQYFRVREEMTADVRAACIRILKILVSKRGAQTVSTQYSFLGEEFHHGGKKNEYWIATSTIVGTSSLDKARTVCGINRSKKSSTQISQDSSRLLQALKNLARHSTDANILEYLSLSLVSSSLHHRLHIPCLSPCQ